MPGSFTQLTRLKLLHLLSICLKLQRQLLQPLLQRMLLCRERVRCRLQRLLMLRILGHLCMSGRDSNSWHHKASQPYSLLRGP